MIKESKICTIEYAVIILLWALALTTPLLFADDLSQNWTAIHVMWAECAVVGVAFAINRFLLMPRLFFRKKYERYVIAILLLFLFLAAFVLILDGVNLILSLIGEGHLHETLQPIIGDIPPHRPPHGTPPVATHPIAAPTPRINTVIPPSITVIILSAIVIALDMGLSIAIKWVVSEQKQAEIKRERVSTQLANLQSQVSPHFFMNTLNNIHALVEIDPKRAQKTIIELSGLMDYLLYESSNQELISLKREIEFTNSYINLMRLRYPKRVSIEFTHDEDIPSVKIPPLLFLNFIENTFKYGVDYNQHSFIKINFSFSDNHIEMETLNSNHSATVKISRHGLGISNSRKRLKLLYGNDFSLKISEKEAIYCVTLRIPIK